MKEPVGMHSSELEHAMSSNPGATMTYEPKSPAQHYIIAENIGIEVVATMSEISEADQRGEVIPSDGLTWSAVQASIGLAQMHAALANVDVNTYQRAQLIHRGTLA